MNYFRYIIDRIEFHLTNRFKPLIVHTEAIYLDDVWEKVKKKALTGKVLRWYVMTPENYNYYKASLNVHISKKRMSQLMKKRYAWLIEHGQKLELHIHLSKLMNFTYKEQKILFEKSLSWFKKELGYMPSEFVPGWWAYNQDTLKILKEYKIKMIKENTYRSIHDYNWVM